MLRVIFLFCAFCLNAISFCMKTENQGNSAKNYVFIYLRANADARLGTALLPQSAFDQRLMSARKVESVLSCADTCGVALFASLKSAKELRRVLDAIDTHSISSYLIDVEDTMKTFSGLNKMNSTPELSQDLAKLMLFAPESKTFSLKEWLERCDCLCQGRDNYELSSFDYDYPLERALYILFTVIDFGFFGFFVPKADKWQYVRYTCGALRTYLYHVYGVSITASPNNPQSSYIPILETCYSFFSQKIAENKAAKAAQ